MLANAYEIRTSLSVFSIGFFIREYIIVLSFDICALFVKFVQRDIVGDFIFVIFRFEYSCGFGRFDGSGVVVDRACEHVSKLA